MAKKNYPPDVACADDKAAIEDNSTNRLLTHGHYWQVAAVKHTTRLNLNLNFTGLYYEILNGPNKTNKDTNHDCFDAIIELDILHKDNYKDTLIIHTDTKR